MNSPVLAERILGATNRPLSTRYGNGSGCLTAIGRDQEGNAGGAIVAAHGPWRQRQDLCPYPSSG